MATLVSALLLFDYLSRIVGGVCGVLRCFTTISVDVNKRPAADEVYLPPPFYKRFRE